MWLVERLTVARRATVLLEHKQQLLRREQRRLTELADRTASEWRNLAVEAETWNARALVTGGRDELGHLESVVGDAEVHLEWTSQAGVAYPSAAAVDLPPTVSMAGPLALSDAAVACRRALEAAVRHAAATTALAHVEAEVIATMRRLRAIRDRWLPRLESQLRELDLRLEETEREEIIHLHWAGRRSATPPEGHP